MTAWLSAFLLTQLIEVPIYVYALRGREHRLWIALGASALTHPIVYWVFPLIQVDYLAQVSYAEAFAVLGEAIWLSWFGLERSVLWAGLANLFSVVIGLSLRAWVGWP